MPATGLFEVGIATSHWHRNTEQEYRFSRDRGGELLVCPADTVLSACPRIPCALWHSEDSEGNYVPECCFHGFPHDFSLYILPALWTALGAVYAGLLCSILETGTELNGRDNVELCWEDQIRKFWRIVDLQGD